MATLKFYETSTGSKLVERELDALTGDARVRVLAVTARVAAGHATRNQSRHVRGPIYEVRIAHDKNEFRLLFATVAGESVMLGLHLVHKKTQKLPRQAIELAEHRLADWTRRPCRTS